MSPNLTETLSLDMILCLVLLRACMIDSSHVTFELSLSFLSRTAIAPYCALQVTQQVFMLRQAWAICFCFHSFNACPGENILFSFLFLFQKSPFRSMEETLWDGQVNSCEGKGHPWMYVLCSAHFPTCSVMWTQPPSSSHPLQRLQAEPR